MSSNNWQTTQPPKPKVVPIGDADTLLGQLQLANQSLTQVANPAPLNVRPEAIPTMGWPIYIDSSLAVVADMFTSLASNPQQLLYVQTMDPLGTIVTNKVQMNYPAAYSGENTVVPLQEGWLLAVELGGANTKIKRGQMYVQCYLGYASGGGAAQMLFNDYNATGYNCSWPNGRVVAPTEGPGHIYNAGVVPAVGAEISFAVPDRRRAGGL